VLEESAILTKAQFASKYPHSWLLCEAHKPPSAVPRRLEIASPATVMAAPIHKPSEDPLSHAAIRSQPDRFLLFALVKTDRNPWADRILVGRAKNNDVVLNNQSVSKVHACFAKNGARMQLSAYETLNPTLLNGAPVTPNGPAIPVNDGADVKFGTVQCRYLETGSLHTLLSGRP